MRVSLNQGRMRALAILGIVALAWVFVTQHVGVLSVSGPKLDQLHFVGALCVLGITLVGLAKLFRNR